MFKIKIEFFVIFIRIKFKTELIKHEVIHIKILFILVHTYVVTNRVTIIN